MNTAESTYVGPNDPRVQAAYHRVVALRELTKETGTQTNRTQSAILMALSPQVLAAVALLLQNRSGHVAK